ncbi:hypothetical protein DFH09DRAFT_1090683 [Mycena vulgaris]|nr:hypothetical protein DFH09DRAFT_1090683 [Mycena vulgaris]
MASLLRHVVFERRRELSIALDTNSPTNERRNFTSPSESDVRSSDAWRFGGGVDVSIGVSLKAVGAEGGAEGEESRLARAGAANAEGGEGGESTLARANAEGGLEFLDAGERLLREREAQRTKPEPEGLAEVAEAAVAEAEVAEAGDSGGVLTLLLEGVLELEVELELDGEAVVTGGEEGAKCEGGDGGEGSVAGRGRTPGPMSCVGKCLSGGGAAEAGVVEGAAEVDAVEASDNGSPIESASTPGIDACESEPQLAGDALSRSGWALEHLPPGTSIPGVDGDDVNGGGFGGRGCALVEAETGLEVEVGGTDMRDQDGRATRVGGREA